MKTVNCEGVDYLAHEAEGNAARWIMPLAQYYCKGDGLDVGCSRPEWAFPGSHMIDPIINPDYDAMHLPSRVNGWEYLFSSHMLEHLEGNWMTCLDYWLSEIKVGGILFLYLPHASQNYWQPRNNRKHIHSFHGPEIDAYLKGLGHQVFVSGVDANHSFTVICEKRDQNEANIKMGDGQSSWSDLPYKKVNLYPTDEEINQHLENQKIKASCKIHESRWFEQNTEDLANKIADMRMEQESSLNLIHAIECPMCKTLFNIIGSRYSDRSEQPVTGDYVACPQCNTFYIFTKEMALYKPNVFHTKSVRA